MEKVREFLNRVLVKNETIVVACSGGPDSMCLLSLLTEFKDKFNLKLICAHVNHKIRLESEEERNMVQKFCEDNNIVFEYLEILEYVNGDFTEEDARKRRYKFFDEVMVSHKANTLMTAHHGDDLIETILMRITRGSNLSGFIGIKKVNENEKYRIVRPLLYVSKDEIIDYLDTNNISYAIDKTNESDSYTRNRYRHKVLPFLKKENKDVHKKYLKFSEELEEYDKFVNDYINKKEFIVDNFIDINKLKDESNFIKRKCIELLIKRIQINDLFDVRDSEVTELLKLFNNDNISIDLNNGYKGVSSYGKIKIIKLANEGFEEVIIDKDIEIGDFKFYFNPVEGNNSNNCIYLNSSEIDLPLKLKMVNSGDRIKVKNLKGTKKVNDVFIDSKIPKYKRNNYPILVDNKNEILWIPNVKKSQFAKDKSEKYDIIIRCEAR